MKTKITVPDAEAMTIQTFRMHIQARHRHLGFWTLNEHAQSHRLHKNLDHIHAENPREPEGDNAA